MATWLSATLLIQGDRRIAVRKDQTRGNQANIIGVSHLVVVLSNQHLAIAQTDYKATGIGGFDAEAGYFHASRNRQLLLQNRLSVLRLEETHLTTAGHADSHLALLFHRQHQRRVVGLHPAGAVALLLFDLGTTKQRQHLVQQVKEDQQNGHNDAQTAHRNIPAGEMVLEMTRRPVALHRWRIEVHARGFGWGLSSHGAHPTGSI